MASATAENVPKTAEDKENGSQQVQLVWRECDNTFFGCTVCLLNLPTCKAIDPLEEKKGVIKLGSAFFLKLMAMSLLGISI